MADRLWKLIEFAAWLLADIAHDIHNAKLHLLALLLVEFSHTRRDRDTERDCI